VLLRWQRAYAAALALAAAAGLGSQTCWAIAAQQVASANYADLSFEELGNIEITSVSRRPQSLSDAAASVFVISRDDIRRSGARSIPEALRLAPNLEIARINASEYAISARGFLSTSNKLLVLIDGRSVYSPLYSGVFWDVQDVVLEDIDRIEVISGPGGTLWGINAVNGVINIITRSAGDTQGGLVDVGVGNRDTIGVARIGARTANDVIYRVYGKVFDRDTTITPEGNQAGDAWHKSQAGFRADWSSGEETFSAHGDAYQGVEGQPLPGEIAISGVTIPYGDVTVSGANVVARWNRTLSETSTVNLTSYIDHTQRHAPPEFADVETIFDVQFEHSLVVARDHAVVWGAEYRYGIDDTEPASFPFPGTSSTPLFAFLPEHLDQSWPALFAQDEIHLGDPFRVTIGARVERNQYTGTQFLPNLRFAWKFLPDELLWAAASRTMRAPSRLDHDTYVPGAPPFVLAGGPNVQPEFVDVYEIGYRGQWANRFSYSVTAYHAAYEDLQSAEVNFNTPSPYEYFADRLAASTNGVEAWGSYQLTDSWRIRAGFTSLRLGMHLRPGGSDTTQLLEEEGGDPRQSWQLRTDLALPYRTEFDAGVRHVASLSDPDVPGYTVTDLRVAWHARSDLELSLTGDNLFSGRHAEWGALPTRSVFGPDVFLRATWRL
jgi:iron complex outermembrane receptor protein